MNPLEDESEPVVEKCKDQRWPEAGEPVCVMCGRYGAYICDQTDRDVCSLECKRRHLQTQQSAAKPAPYTCPHQGDHFGQSEKKHLNEEQVTAIRRELQIEVDGPDVGPPVLEFSDCADKLPELLRDNMRQVGMDAPTPVQMQVLPPALCGRHLIATAPPGSGKSGAFLLPILAQIAHNTLPGPSPRALIVVATRELAHQLEEQTKKLAKGLPNLHTALVVGGLPYKPQVHRLRTAAQVVIATPGRLHMILSSKITEQDFLSDVLAVVLDEFDRMLHEEFEKELVPILDQLPNNVQMMMFSATLSERVKAAAQKYLSNPVTVRVGTLNAPSESVQQTIVWLEESSKKEHLFALLQNSKHYRPPVIIFVNQQQGAELLAAAIQKVCGLSTLFIHGAMAQTERQEAVAKFSSGHSPVLVSTPLLGRGMDMPHVKQVINFDMPRNMAEFVHQTGRAGRLGTTGHAMTFINNSSQRLFLDLVNMLEATGVRLPVQLLHSPALQQQRLLAQAGQKKTPAAKESKSERRGEKRKHEPFTRESLLGILQKAHRKKH